MAIEKTFINLISFSDPEINGKLNVLLLTTEILRIYTEEVFNRQKQDPKSLSNPKHDR